MLIMVESLLARRVPNLLSSSTAATSKSASSLLCHGRTNHKNDHRFSPKTLCLAALTTATALAVNDSTRALVGCAIETEEDDFKQLKQKVASETVASSASSSHSFRKGLPESILQYDHYHGVSIHLDDLDETTTAWSAADFAQALLQSLQQWQQEQRKGIWLHVPLSHSDKIQAAVELCGFDYHMVVVTKAPTPTTTTTNTPPPEGESKSSNNNNSNNNNNNNKMLILSRWLPTDTPSRLPLGPTTQVGVGCLVLHPRNPSLMLVVQEKTGPAAAAQLWKVGRCMALLLLLVVGNAGR